jgi:hypothetical protein
VVTLELVQGGRGVRWKGTARLEVFGSTHRATLLHDLGKIDLAAKVYATGVATMLRRARTLASKLSGFQPAAMPTRTSCYLRSRCGPFRVTARAGKLHVRFTRAPGLPGAKPRTSHRLTPPARSVRALLALVFALTRKVASPQVWKSAWSEAVSAFTVYELFRYQIGKRHVWVVSMASGDGRDIKATRASKPGAKWKYSWPKPKARPWPPKGCSKLEKCPPPRSVLHHGAHFDHVISW